MIPLRKNKRINSAGIYMISSENNKKYIGSTLHLSVRIFKGHLTSLRRNIHHSILLQKHFNKYGIDDLWFDILEFVHKENKETIEEYRLRLLSREQYWIDYYNSIDPKKGFNICPTAGSCLGSHHSEESKQKRVNT